MVGIRLEDMAKVIAVKRPRVWGLYFKKWVAVKRLPLDIQLPKRPYSSALGELHQVLHCGGRSLPSCNDWFARQREGYRL